MGRRRAKGTGSVFQRGDGRWVAAVLIGGKRVVRYSWTRNDAERKVVDLLVERDRRTVGGLQTITLNEWVEMWLQDAELRLRPSTINSYRSTIKLITDVVGAQRIDSLTPLRLKTVFQQLQRDGRGARRLHQAHTHLKTCLRDAVDLGLLGANPLDRVRKPAWRPRERPYWSVEEAGRFIETGISTPGRWGPLFAFLTSTGMRVSEALGLNWSDVDFDDRTVSVQRALVWSGTALDLLPPKTKAGYRIVSLPDAAIQALRRIESENSLDKPVFRTSTGEPPTLSHLREALIRLCSEAGVTVLNIHGLRHVHAMLALEATGDAYLVQRRLGHSRISVTLGLYGYSARRDSSVAGALNDLLNRREGTNGSSVP